MVGDEHERLADALRAGITQAPAPADTLVQRFRLPVDAETRSTMTDCNRSILVQAGEREVVYRFGAKSLERRDLGARVHP